MEKRILEKLISEIGYPCITISMNTHRTHPDNLQDSLVLKNLLKEARMRIVNESEITSIVKVIEKINLVEKEIDINYNLESLHIFLSDQTTEIIKSTWPVIENTVHVGDKFAIRPLIKILNRTEFYHILLLSQSGVRLFYASNDGISGEITSEGFPFPENPHYLDDPEKLSDAKLVDNMVREYLNQIDKAVIRVHNNTGLGIVVICTEDNYRRLIQVADKPYVYLGFCRINYNDTSDRKLAVDSWEIIRKLGEIKVKEAFKEIKNAVGQGKVTTDLSEIYRLAREGRGDLLMVNENFHQPVKKTGELTFEYAYDPSLPNVIDDIGNEIAWEIISKKGRVLFTDNEEIKSYGEIVMKMRY